MLFKLAIKNLKKSIKDFSIYFFTLVVGVAIFYIFNSLDAQNSMLIMSKSKYEIVQELIVLLGYVSVFISIVLGFLVIYSNQFLIKRRKKEFGLYLTLGMSKWSVSTILVIETLIVGALSLIIGLFIGVILSQFLSAFVIKLFEANMSGFKFVFSSSALIKTIIYFSIIFILVMIFNVISVSKNKLINLITAAKKNEKVKMRNKWVIIISFITSIALLFYAYKLLFTGILFYMDARVIPMLVAGTIGTYLLFFSVAGIFLKIAELSKKLYFKNLNMFILKQINSKANTTVLSTTIICLMLLLTIGILSGSMSMMNAFNDGIAENNVTDFTIYVGDTYSRINNEGQLITEKIDSNLKGLTSEQFFKEYVKAYAYYDLYEAVDGLNPTQFVSEAAKKKLEDKYKEAINLENGSISVISESAFNAIMKLYGRDQINIDPNQYIMTANMEEMITAYSDLYEDGNKIDFNGKKLTPATKEIVNMSLRNFSSYSNMGTIVLDDSLMNYVNDIAGNNYQVIIGNYIDTEDVYTLEKEFRYNCDFAVVKYNKDGFAFLTKIEMQESNIGIKAILIFLGVYLGIVFAISSATVLAIGQLSESSDNKERYLILKQIGADQKMIDRALFTQIFIVFFTPLLVAIIHAVFALNELNKAIMLLGSVDMSANIFITSLFIILVYGGYFLATYLCSKNIIKEK